jgi:hypothetical protein
VLVLDYFWRSREVLVETHFLSHLYIKINILPRQARDKHRENSKKVSTVCVCVCVCVVCVCVCVCVCAWLQSAEASLVLEKAIAEEMKQKAAQLEKELASRMISLDKAEAAAEISATRR